jgi:hypothetical protein
MKFTQKKTQTLAALLVVCLGNHRQNSLFDTEKHTHYFLGSQNFFLPLLTLSSNFIPHMTLPSILLASAVTFAWPAYQFWVNGQKYPYLLR